MTSVCSCECLGQQGHSTPQQGSLQLITDTKEVKSFTFSSTSPTYTPYTQNGMEPDGIQPYFRVELRVWYMPSCHSNSQFEIIKTSVRSLLNYTYEYLQIHSIEPLPVLANDAESIGRNSWLLVCTNLVKWFCAAVPKIFLKIQYELKTPELHYFLSLLRVITISHLYSTLS